MFFRFQEDPFDFLDLKTIYKRINLKENMSVEKMIIYIYLLNYKKRSSEVEGQRFLDSLLLKKHEWDYGWKQMYVNTIVWRLKSCLFERFFKCLNCFILWLLQFWFLSFKFRDKIRIISHLYYLLFFQSYFIFYTLLREITLSYLRI